MMMSSKVVFIYFLAFHMLLLLPGVEATEALESTPGGATDPFTEKHLKSVEEDDEGDGPEVFSMLQMPGKLAAKKVEKRPEERPEGAPYVVNLRREVVPIYRNGEVVSFKTSHSGLITVGDPAEEFRVVFDTGSGHVVLPSAECKSEACIEHKRYNVARSMGAFAINVDGSRVPPGKLCDQVTIGFGTGSVTGQFVREKVCFVPNECVMLNMVEAVEMTDQPFKSFLFDGIFGLGLNKLSLSPAFSFLTTMQKSNKVKNPWFGVYLTDGENGEESEIALGGSNPRRYEGDLQWAKVAMPQLGHWQVAIHAIRIGGKTMDICEDGTCRGIVDTGTSHLGIPGTAVQEIADLLTVTLDNELDDCRHAKGINVEIDVGNFTLELSPHNYMRKLPLQDGVTVGSKNGVSLTKEEEQQEEEAPAATAVKRCKPRLMPVNLPAPLGPKLFLLGEPVLHRYYTVYNWETAHIGFGLAKRFDKEAPNDPAGEDASVLV
eukprot:gnl/TRDRNA2_/TRDRNA2_179530_c0_seq1.p1 gnl/TRDRNA2_/TRDRNA2_179530_c0~~gnl/TRDRNA2_/TRDRNA2_179530_c0_seq1.p1  ORF type:complete len:490 (+),score=120.97 gnl/TRDRNA2_/TRDRNA2_179530_c0_seq1:81-1550(+)